MPMIRAIRLLNAVEAGTANAAALQALLADAGRAGEFNMLLAMPGQSRRIVNNPVTLSTILASSAATGMMVASRQAMTTITESAPALAALMATPAAMTSLMASAAGMEAIWGTDTSADAFLNSASVRLSIYNSDTALAALQATPSQVQRQIMVRATSKTFSNSEVVSNGTKLILLRRYYEGAWANSEYDSISWGRGQTVAAIGNGPSGGGRQLFTGKASEGCVLGSYTSNRMRAVQNDYTGNFVAAANGLQRGAWAGDYPAPLTTYYIPV